jgi:hypothetical protein
VSRRTPDAAQSITSAPEPLGADQSRRARRYLQQMSVRVVCFLLAVLLWGRVPMWLSIVFVVGAVVLPYTAVLFANAGRERRDVGPQVVLPPVLGAAPRVRPLAEDTPAPARDDDPPATTRDDDPTGGPR